MALIYPVKSLPLRSRALGFLRSAAAQRKFQDAPQASCAGVIVPLCGFGPLNSTLNFSSLVPNFSWISEIDTKFNPSIGGAFSLASPGFQDTWPSLYDNCVINITDSNGVWLNWSNIYYPYYSNGAPNVVVSNTNSGAIPYHPASADMNGAIVTGTQLTQTWNANGGNPSGTITITLSGLIDYAAVVSLAEGYLNEVGLDGLSNNVSVPSFSPGFSFIGAGVTYIGCACLGTPVRFISGEHWVSPAQIADYGLPEGGPWLKGYGGVFCAKSSWFLPYPLGTQLTQSDPLTGATVFGNLAGNLTRQTLYLAPWILSGGLVVAGAVSAVRGSIIRGVYNYQPADVLASGATYGELGHRSGWV